MLISSIVRLTLGIKGPSCGFYQSCEQRAANRLGCEEGTEASLQRMREKIPVKDKVRERCWRHGLSLGIAVFLFYRPRRVRCAEHGIKVEQIPWSMGKKPISFPLITILAFWTRMLPWDQVARLFGVSWNTVSSAVDAAVAYGREREDYRGVRFIGIDEISRKKGHVYHTQVYDLERKRLIWTGANRDKDSSEIFRMVGKGAHRCY